MQVIRRRWAVRLCAAILGCLGTLSSVAQSPSPSDFVFDDTSVADVLIAIDPAQLADMYAPGNQYSDEERLARFAFVRGTDTVRVDSVGFRFRGNTSRDSQKKSFKVSFNTFRSGQKFYGLEKLNLNGEHNDPSIIRSKVGWDLFRTVETPASRANHVRLFINGRYYGLYVNVEHVDEQFLQRYFGNDDGNLYKCLWPADLAWLGPDRDAYRGLGQERRPYDLKLKDDDTGAYDDLVGLIDVLNHADGSVFPEAIEEVFDVTGFLRVLAVTTITGSWDSYWFLKNNYYLYANPETGKFHFVPFDFDNTMGIWWDGIWPGLDWRSRNVYNWGHPNPQEFRPLADRILAVPEFRSRYTLYLRKLIEGPFESNGLTSRALQLRSMIEGAAAEDTFRTKDYGYSLLDFHDSYFRPLGGHVTEGLIPFISERTRTAAIQLDALDIPPVISELRAEPPSGRPGSTTIVSARVEDEGEPLAVTLLYAIGSGTESELAMMPRPDLGLDRYAATLTVPGEPSTVRYRVRATDGAGQTSFTDARSLVVLGAVSLVLNEFMASNTSTVQDPAGEFDDWVELHNVGEFGVNVAGYTLSDDSLRPDKWTLPDTTIGPGGFLLVWADEDGAQGSLHANFKLSKLGEYLGLYDPARVPLDTISFSAQLDDVSFGRTPDGASRWTPQATATPGGPNAGAVGVEVEIPGESGNLIAWPSPFRESVVMRVPGATGGRFYVVDVLGRIVAIHTVGKEDSADFVWDGRSGGGKRAAAGVYVVRYQSSEYDRATTIVRAN